MNPYEKPYQELHASIVADEASLAAKRIALEFLGRQRDSYVPDSPQVPASATSAPADVKPADIGEIDLSGLLPEDQAHRRRTLTDEVREVSQRLGRQEFTNASVEAVLKRFGIEIAAKAPRARISLALSKLVEEGVLVRTFVGAGNVPHRYRLRASMTESEMAALPANQAEQAGSTDFFGATPDDKDQPSADNVVRLA